MARLPKDLMWIGNVLYARFDLNGITIKRSLKTDDLETAKLALAELRKRYILEGFGLKKVPTFRKAAQMWLDHNSNKVGEDHIRTAKIFFDKHLNPVLGDYTLDRISTEVVTKLINDFMATHSKGSANALRKYLNIVTNHAIRLKYLKVKPYEVERLTPDRKPKVTLPTAELSGFIDFCYKHHRSAHNQTALMITLALLTGMREGEIIGAKVEWLNLTEKTLTVHHSKTGDYRVVPLSPPLVGKLQTYLDATGLSLGLLFPGRKGKQHCRSFIYWAITRLAAKYGVHGKFGAHSCRHSYITINIHE